MHFRYGRDWARQSVKTPVVGEWNAFVEGLIPPA